MKPQALKRTARKLRANQTKYERLFAAKLSAWSIRYKAQAIVGPWIADFLLRGYQLVVEIDGRNHFTKAGVLRDRLRDDWLERHGFRVVHIGNEDVASSEFTDLFESDKNGVVVEEDGFPAYITEFLECFPP